jgi:hypothetical protein
MCLPILGTYIRPPRRYQVRVTIEVGEAGRGGSARPNLTGALCKRCGPLLAPGWRHLGDVLAGFCPTRVRGVAGLHDHAAERISLDPLPGR